MILLNGEIIDRSELVASTDNTYVLYSADIIATEFAKAQVIELVDGDGNLISKVEYNLNAYLANKYEDANEGELVKALSNYGASAVKYADSLVSDEDFDFDGEDIL